VQDADYITGLAERSAARVTDPPPPWPTDHPRRLRHTLSDTLRSHRDADGEFPDGRQYRLVDIAVLHNTRVLRARLRLDDGQTAVVDLRTDPTAEESNRAKRDLRKQPPQQLQSGSRQPNDKRESTTTGHENATPTPHTRPSTVHSTQREASVTLTTRDLARSATFYAKITGRIIPAHADTAEIAPGLLLHRAAPDTLISDSSDIVHITIHITVDDLAAAARRLGIDTTTTHSDTATIEVRDPEERIVRINQRVQPEQPTEPVVHTTDQTEESISNQPREQPPYDTGPEDDRQLTLL
jgi:hypothetical protein